MHLDEGKLFSDLCDLPNSVKVQLFFNQKKHFISRDLIIRFEAYMVESKKKQHFGRKLWHIWQLVRWIRRWETFPPSFPPA